MKKVGIVMGSDSDLPILRKTMDTLTSLGIPYECHIYSAHRTPEEARDFAASARENGFGVLIAAAGMAAHLAGGGDAVHVVVAEHGDLLPPGHGESHPSGGLVHIRHQKGVKQGRVAV